MVRGLGLAVALPIVAMGAYWTPQLVIHSQRQASPPAATDRVLVAEPAVQESARNQADDRADESSGFVDLYGNDVSDAIATYTFDQAGSLYELHSPQTELPHLGIPKS